MIVAEQGKQKMSRLASMTVEAVSIFLFYNASGGLLHAFSDAFPIPFNGGLWHDVFPCDRVTVNGFDLTSSSESSLYWETLGYYAVVCTQQMAVHSSLAFVLYCTWKCFYQKRLSPIPFASFWTNNPRQEPRYALALLLARTPHTRDRRAVTESHQASEPRHLCTRLVWWLPRVPPSPDAAVRTHAAVHWATQVWRLNIQTVIPDCPLHVPKTFARTPPARRSSCCGGVRNPCPFVFKTPRILSPIRVWKGPARPPGRWCRPEADRPSRRDEDTTLCVARAHKNRIECRVAKVKRVSCGNGGLYACTE